MKFPIVPQNHRFLIFFVGLFLLALTAHASGPSQLVDDTDTGNVDTSAGSSAQIVTGISGTLDTLTIKYCSNTSNPIFQNILEFNSEADANARTGTTAYWALNALTFASCGSPATYTISSSSVSGYGLGAGSSAVVFQPGKFYSLEMGNGSTNRWLGSGTDDYSGGSFCPQYGACGTNAVKDIYFSISLVGVAPAVPTASWVVPTSTSTPIADFTAWKIYASNLSTSTTYTASVEYTGGLVAGFTSNYDFSTGYAPNGTTSTISIAKRTSLASGIDGVNYNWVATATIYRDDNALNGTANVVFVVGSPGGASLTPISLPGTIGGILNNTTTLNSTCDPNDGLIAGSICNLAVLLFYPSPASLNNFNNLASSTQNKPPFGYLTSFVGALNGVQGVSTATSSLVLIATSTEASLDVIFGPIKVGVGWLLWLLLGFWGVSRLKIFNP
jgi:hypothetical protein